MKKYFERFALILCIAAIIAFVFVLWGRRENSEEAEATYVLSENYTAEAIDELSPPTIYIYEIEDDPSPYAEHTIPWCGEELYPIVVDVPQWYVELLPLPQYTPEVIEPARKSPSDLQLALFAHMAFFPIRF